MLVLALWKNSPSNELIQKFAPPANPGSLFLSFEGIEGAGKSYQINVVKEFLEASGKNVLILREPGGTMFGEKLREAILNSKEQLHPLAEAHLFASSRTQLLQDVILKELETTNTVIICDRYIDSSLAYQGQARGLGFSTILKIHENYPLHVVPHMTFYLRISLETSLERQKIRDNPKDYFESEGGKFHLKLIEGYDLARDMFPNRIVTIDGEKDIANVSEQIIQKLKNII